MSTVKENIKTYNNIPSMTPECVHKYLYKIGTEWSGEGIAIELGSWLGATAVPLLKGLKKAGYDNPFISYDNWKVTEKQILKAEIQGVKINKDTNLKIEFLRNVRNVYDYLVCRKGEIQNTIIKYNDFPIEICIFDAPKSDPLFDISIRSLLPYFIPGTTILGLLDYNSYKKKDGDQREKLLAPVRFIDRNSDYFQKIAEWPDQCSCVFFKYTKKLNL